MRHSGVLRSAAGVPARRRGVSGGGWQGATHTSFSNETMFHSYPQTGAKNDFSGSPVSVGVVGCSVVLAGDGVDC